MGIAGGPDLITDGLILDLDAANSKSYPGSGSSWYDLSANNYNGTLRNSPTKSNNYFSFDGTNQDILLGDIPALQFERTNSFSCCGLAYNSNVNAINLSLIGNSQTPTAYKGWTFSFFNRSSIKANALCLGLYDNGTNVPPKLIEVHTAINSISQNVWYHVACTYDGSSSSNGVKLYINGIQQSTTASYNNLTDTIVVSGQSLYVGSRGATAQYMNGRISNMQVYNRVLSASEILQNHNALKGRFAL